MFLIRGDQIRAGQPQDRRGDGANHPGDYPRHRRGGDRIMRPEQRPARHEGIERRPELGVVAIVP